jgi:phosphoheptose isomerase
LTLCSPFCRRFDPERQYKPKKTIKERLDSYANKAGVIRLTFRIKQLQLGKGAKTMTALTTATTTTKRYHHKRPGLPMATLSLNPNFTQVVVKDQETNQRQQQWRSWYEVHWQQ